MASPQPQPNSAVTHLSDSSNTVSVWMETGGLPERPSGAAPEASVDVCVIGAGIAGLTVAYQLARAGRKPVVLEDGPIGGGETSRTTGHLASVLDDGFQNMERALGLERLQTAYHSHATAIDTIEEIVRREAIDCDFRRLEGYLLAEPEGAEFLRAEMEAALRAGCADVQFLESTPLPRLQDQPCLIFPRQARFHALKYVQGLLKAIERLGGVVRGESHVQELKPGENGGPATVTTSSGQVYLCQWVVTCTNSPMLVPGINFKSFPYRTYALAGPVPRGSMPDALYWDNADPYHYVRLQEQDENWDLLIVGGEDHKTGHEKDAMEAYQALEAWANERFPAMAHISWRWSGQVMEPVDGLAYIGRAPKMENVLLCTGDSGMGLTHATIAGIMLPAIIETGSHSWEDTYSPQRSALHAPMEWVRDLAKVVAQQGARLIPGKLPTSADDLQPGEGAVIAKGLDRIAAYRDDSGSLHCHKGFCTHMNCILSWNGEEKSFDCSCHGSRFDTNGQPINGPALTPLETVHLEETAKK